MAITKLVSPSVPNPTVSGAGGSWDLAMAQLTACKKMLSGEQMILTQWTNATVLPALKLGSYLQHAGTIYVVDTADYAITAPTSDGTYYIRLAVSAETLAVSFISSLSGYSWNTQHNGLYDSSNNQVLPYQVVRTGGSYAKRRILNPYHTSGFSTIDYLGNIIGGTLTLSGNIIGGALTLSGNATIAGHDIDSELDTLNSRVNQDVKTTARPAFNDLLPSFSSPLVAGDVLILKQYSNSIYTPTNYNNWVQIGNAFTQRSFTALNPETACLSVRVKLYGYGRVGSDATNCKVRIKRNGAVIITSDTINSTDYVLVGTLDIDYTSDDSFTLEGLQSYSNVTYSYVYVKAEIVVNRTFNKLESLYN
jgi:hypothetical protein